MEDLFRIPELRPVFWFSYLPMHYRDALQTTMFLIPLFPLLGFLLNGCFGRTFSRKACGLIAVSAALASFAWALLCALALEPLPGTTSPETRSSMHAIYGTWISTPYFSSAFGLYFDQITAVMILIVTGVGALIHFYSLGYMAHDEGAPRFFAYMNLFLFAMCVLVLADNLVLMFVGWEGVGLCSYLLIGHWYEDSKNAAAGMKAFVVNRIGDMGFILGIFTLIAVFGTVDYVAPAQGGKTYQTVAADGYVKLPEQPGLLDYGEALRLISSTHRPESTNLTVGGSGSKPVSNWNLSRIEGAPRLQGLTITVALTLACALLFIGAMGKSAQIPLYVWLPDAMAGPTPVSALIHAATMVTAGVYMVCRLNGLFAASPEVLKMIAIVGACTALLSGLIGLTQLDIKRVLAYSTVSQLGYMFLALGVGMFSLGLFHLFTHAFFKALLFLAAGVVIHAMSGEQDLRYMGGLRSKLPRTFWTMLIGGAALAGVPFLAGWYSKDAILLSVLARYFDTHDPLYLVLWIFAVLTAFCTAFYTFRLIALAFFGENRAKPEVQEHIHEPVGSMTVPLYVLAALSLLAGFVWNYKFAGDAQQTLGISNLLDLTPEARAHEHHINLAATLAVVVAGIVLALWLYVRKRHVPEPAKSRNFLYRLSLNKFYVDETYDVLLVTPFMVGSEILNWGIETLFIDLIVTGTGYLVAFAGSVLRRMQTGVVNTYALAILLGAAAALLYLLKQV
jgi:NADH-quinone oxidoreductase subunit L